MLLLDENNACDFLTDCVTQPEFNPGDILVDGSAIGHPYVRVIAVTRLGILCRRPRGALVTIPAAKLFATKQTAAAAKRVRAVGREIKALKRFKAARDNLYKAVTARRRAEGKDDLQHVQKRQEMRVNRLSFTTDLRRIQPQSCIPMRGVRAKG